MRDFVFYMFLLFYAIAFSLFGYFKGIDRENTRAIACLDMHYVEKCIRGEI